MPSATGNDPGIRCERPWPANAGITMKIALKNERGGQHGPTQRLLGNSIFLGDLLVGRPGERAVAEAERLGEAHHPAEHGHVAVLVGPVGRLAHVDADLAVGGANRDRPGLGAAHHHAFEHRLATHVTRFGHVSPR